MSEKPTSIIIVSAPSGCGKDTIIEKVCQRLDGIGVSISCTTRKARKKKDGTYEQHGVDYFFIDKSEFEVRIRENADTKKSRRITPASAISGKMLLCAEYGLVFRIVKRQFGYSKTVYRGLQKNANRLYALFLSSNLYMLARAGRSLKKLEVA